MIIEFDDGCWTEEDVEWKQGLVDLLTLLANRSQHSLVAIPALMLSWCDVYLKLHVDYFRVRLAAAQVRANAVKIYISPTGADSVEVLPPWTLKARAAYAIVNQPLRMLLENDHSDKLFVESTIPSFANWCSRGWIVPEMGGGSDMKRKILEASTDLTARWRTFYMFDSDRLHPAELGAGWSPQAPESCQGHAFEQACTQLPAGRWHRLERRSIENYLPESLLAASDATIAAALFDASVGTMAHFYNYKLGLTGDGVAPATKPLRAARSQGFWTALSPASITALQPGFGKKIAEAFCQLPANHTWPVAVVDEMDALSDALQDAI